MDGVVCYLRDVLIKRTIQSFAFHVVVVVVVFRESGAPGGDALKYFRCHRGESCRHHGVCADHPKP